jgi:hypothetical protein
VARWKVGDTLILFLLKVFFVIARNSRKGKCGRGFSHLGENAGEADKTRKDLSSCYEENEGRKESIHTYLFEEKNKVYGINLVLKRSLWSRFTHHQIDRYYGGLLMVAFRIEAMRSPSIRSGQYSK